MCARISRWCATARSCFPESINSRSSETALDGRSPLLPIRRFPRLVDVGLGGRGESRTRLARHRDIGHRGTEPQSRPNDSLCLGVSVAHFSVSRSPWDDFCHGLLVVVLAAAPALAQSAPTGTIRGTVVDTHGGTPLRRVSVRLQATGQTTVTDDEGHFL